jgi:hypothetical protein
MWSRAKIKAGITVSCATLSLEDMQLKLNDSYASYKLAKKSHKSSRLSFAENFAPKDCDRNEEAQQKGRLARVITGKIQGQGVTIIQHAELRDGVEVLTDCNTPAQINDTLMEVNSKKYQQCDASGFLQEPLLSLFGYSGQLEHTESVLDGSFVYPPNTDQYSALLCQPTYAMTPKYVTPQ